MNEEIEALLKMAIDRKDMNFSKHQAVVAAFGQHFVKNRDIQT